MQGVGRCPGPLCGSPDNVGDRDLLPPSRMNIKALLPSQPSLSATPVGGCGTSLQPGKCECGQCECESRGFHLTFTEGEATVFSMVFGEEKLLSKFSVL